MAESNGKRDSILKAAWGLIRQYGYAKTTIQDIAARAGIGKGTVYLYFNSKADIMLALVDLTNDRIATDLEVISRRGAAPEERLRACILHRVMTIFDLVHRYPHGEEIITSMKPEIVRRIDGYVQKQGALLGRILEEGCRSGDFKCDNPIATGFMLANCFELLTPPYYRFGTRESIERFAQAVLDLFLNGLHATEDPRESRSTRRRVLASGSGRIGHHAKEATMRSQQGKPDERSIRCLNCFARFIPVPGADQAICPNCRITWRISWLRPKAPKIRGPVWDQYPNPKE